MRVNFQEVKLFGDKTVKCCGGCGRRLKRTKKFYQTLNPFNKTTEGRIKEYDDIYPELKAELAAWKTQPERCSHCV
jgi:predicted methyltransferase